MLGIRNLYQTNDCTASVFLPYLHVYHSGTFMKSGHMYNISTKQKTCSLKL